jgi:hypothetical protein
MRKMVLKGKDDPYMCTSWPVSSRVGGNRRCFNKSVS